LAETGYLGPPVDLWALGAVALEVLETAPLMNTLITLITWGVLWALGAVALEVLETAPLMTTLIIS
jgi:hypothetical protein